MTMTMTITITGSVFRGFVLILQKRHFHVNRYENVSKQDRCIDIRQAFVIVYGEGRFICLLRSDWVIAQLVRQNRLESRTSYNSFSPDFHMSGTFERHVTLYY